MVRMDTAPLDRAPPSISLKHYRPVSPKDMILATADFQTAGRGQAGNSWESEAGKNLLFGLLFHPREVEANRQFILSPSHGTVCLRNIVRLCQRHLRQMAERHLLEGPENLRHAHREHPDRKMHRELHHRSRHQYKPTNVLQRCPQSGLAPTNHRKRRGTGIHLSRHHQTFQGLLPEHPTRPNGGHRP